MTTQVDRGEIDGRRARHSSGPKTPGGKSRSRFNAVKHGCRARSAILPGEDPHAYQDRLDAWIGKFRPADPVELYLVESAVHASWQLDRADRAEVARLAAGSAEEAARRARKAARLGADLFRVPARAIGTPPPPEPSSGDDGTPLSWPLDPIDEDYPSHRVAALEATVDGRSWLRDRWLDLARILERGRTWQPIDRVRAIRMLGKQPLDFVEDERVLTIYLACHAMDPDGPDVFAEPLSDLDRPRSEAQHQRLTAKYRASRADRAPKDAPAGRAALAAIIAAALARLEGLKDGHAEAAAPSDITARLTHDDKVALDWLRQHQGTCVRSLYRSFEELRKLRRDFGGPPSPDAGPERPPVTRLRSEAAAPAIPQPESPGAPGPLDLDRAPVADAPGPCEDPHEPDGLAPVRPVGDADAPRIVTDVPDDPPGSPASDATPDTGAETLTTESNATPMGLPSAAEPDDDAPDPTNPADRPSESETAVRPVPAVVVVMAMLAMLIGSALTAAFGAAVAARVPSGMVLQEPRSGGRHTAGHGPSAPGTTSLPRNRTNELEPGKDGSIVGDKPTVQREADEVRPDRQAHRATRLDLRRSWTSESDWQFG
jgi:hypothetical protein